jgi:erythromycin esterase-like protein
MLNHESERSSLEHKRCDLEQHMAEFDAREKRFMNSLEAMRGYWKNDPQMFRSFSEAAEETQSYRNEGIRQFDAKLECINQDIRVAKRAEEEEFMKNQAALRSRAEREGDK